MKNLLTDDLLTEETPNPIIAYDTSFVFGNAEFYFSINNSIFGFGNQSGDALIPRTAENLAVKFQNPYSQSSKREVCIKDDKKNIHF
jgi:hypothetical protein